jgi:hypothetical protein
LASRKPGFCLSESEAVSPTPRGSKRIGLQPRAGIGGHTPWPRTQPQRTYIVPDTIPIVAVPTAFECSTRGGLGGVFAGALAAGAPAADRSPQGTELQRALSSCPSFSVLAGRSPSVPILIAAAHRDSQGERHRTGKAERHDTHGIRGPLRCSRIARADRRARRLRRSLGHIPSGANGGTDGNARFRRPRSRPRPA